MAESSLYCDVGIHPASVKECQGEIDVGQQCEVTYSHDAKFVRGFLQWLKLNYEKLRIRRLYIGEQKVDHPKSKEKKQVVVLVIDNEDVITHTTYEWYGKIYYIKCILWGYPSNEGVKVTSHELDCNIDHSTFSPIEVCIKSSSSMLFEKHSNLEFISMSAFRSRNDGDEIREEHCIVFFCTSKGVVPLNEKEFPKEIDGIPTDVREGFFSQFVSAYNLKSATDVLEPLRMGASICRKDHSRSGTLGGFVTMDSGDMGFITAAHIFHDVSSFETSHGFFEVLQPSGGFGDPKVCGTHIKSCGSIRRFGDHTLDAALVKIKGRRRYPKKGIFAGMSVQQLMECDYNLQMLPDYNDGAVRDFRQELSEGKPCIKIGATTGLTRGRLWTIGMSARWIDTDMSLEKPSLKPRVIYFNQLQIIGQQNYSFALPGDSGALVFQVYGDRKEDERLVCIGMVVGGTTDNKTVVTPIAPILEALNVNMHNFN